jgi:NADH-quinone oxidoreductase subunit E
MTTATMSSDVQTVLSGYDQRRQNLIPILQDVQDVLGYLSEDAVNQVADHLGLSENDVFGVATFYTQFRFTPPGRHCIKVCQGTACHVRGSGLIVEELGRRLGIAPGETTEDLNFSLERVACYGSCALAPVVVIDDDVHGRMNAKKAEKLIEELN